jgi:uncharacterized protein (TIGR03437 family)
MDASPIVGRPGQKMKVRYRMLGNVDFGRIIRPDGTIIPLNDDGNGVFSAEITVPQPGVRDVLTAYLGEVRGYVGPDAKCFNNGIINLVTDQVPSARITSLASDAQSSDYIVNLAIPSSQLPDLNALSFSFDPTPIARRFYQLFPDDFDMLNFIIAPGFYENRYHVVVKNTVQGIGLPAMDTTAALGSKGRLLGYNVFPLFFFYDGAERGNVHEIGHQWVSHLTKPPFNVAPHWPPSSLASGIMGTGSAAGTQGLEFPCQIKKSGSDVVTSPGIQTTFTDMDLYLMGLVPSASVADHYVVTDTVLAPQLSSACGLRTLQPSQYTTVHISDILRDYGARFPAANGQPTKLRIANILITRDALASADTMTVADFYARRFEETSPVPTKVGLLRRLGEPMYLATNQSATVQTQLSTTVMPQILAGGIVDAGSFTGGKFLAPGTVASVFGTNMAASPVQASTVPLPTSLGGVQLLINGKPAPLYYVDSGLINFQVPWDINTAVETYPDDPFSYAPMFTARVQRGDLSSNLAYVTSQKDSPAVMIYGDNYAVAQDAQYRTIGPSNPARPNAGAVVYVLGVSSLKEPQTTGAPAPLDHVVPFNAAVSLQIGGVQANVGFAGLTPGGIGLMQVNFTVPSLPPGTYDLKLSVNGSVANTCKLVIGS